MDTRVVLRSIEKSAELALYSARLTEKTLQKKRVDVLSARIEVAQAYGQLEVFERMLIRLGLGESDVMRKVTTSRERVSQIYADICNGDVRREAV